MVKKTARNPSLTAISSAKCAREASGIEAFTRFEFLAKARSSTNPSTIPRFAALRCVENFRRARLTHSPHGWSRGLKASPRMASGVVRENNNVTFVGFRY